MQKTINLLFASLLICQPAFASSPLAYQAALKNEINNDPDGLGYNGKTPQQIADLINNPQTVMVDQAAAPVLPVIVKQVLATMIVVPATLGIDADGNVLGDFPTVQAAITAALATERAKAQYKGMDDATFLNAIKLPQTVKVAVVKPPVIQRLNLGIASAPNIASANDVQSAEVSP